MSAPLGVMFDSRSSVTGVPGSGEVAPAVTTASGIPVGAERTQDIYG